MSPNDSLGLAEILPPKCLGRVNVNSHSVDGSVSQELQKDKLSVDFTKVKPENQVRDDKVAEVEKLLENQRSGRCREQN